jgi:dinuclear metal center YbgI/SA1388 family protein
MRVKEITGFLETYAPLQLQESYDNAGLIVGDKESEVTGALITLDVTPEVLNEAVSTGKNMIIAHHPLIFKGIKKLTGSNTVEQIVIDAIKNDIAIYAAHTNLDNLFEGVNKILAGKLQLENLKILKPQNNSLKKIVCFCPVSHAEQVRNAILGAGAGNIGNYSDCSFNVEGTGTFKAGENTNPFTGKKGKLHFEQEVRIETVVPEYNVNNVITAMKEVHPYEEVAYDIYPLDNFFEKTGAGMTGYLKKATKPEEFLKTVKHTLKGVLRHSPLVNRKIEKVAVCGGSGSFLIDAAYNSGADIFITADIKYHDFFRYNGSMTIVDAGHFETEQFARDLLFDILKKKFPTFALQISNVNTNAVSYF